MAITVNQIAEQCGVSRTTVLRALNGGSVSKDTKERILQVAKDNNYRPNLLARSLNHGRTMSLGVVTINIENMYFVQSLNTINKVINIALIIFIFILIASYSYLIYSFLTQTLQTLN